MMVRASGLLLLELCVILLLLVSTDAFRAPRHVHVARVRAGGAAHLEVPPSSASTSTSCETCDDGSSNASDNSCAAKQQQSPSSFIRKGGAVTAEDLSDLHLVKIVAVNEPMSATDEDVNVLLWKCLGYEYDESDGKWSSDKVFPKWAQKFPLPPDMIGVTRRYDPETDKEVRNASMDLMRSIPRDFKGGVKSLSVSAGWKGFKLSELTPNKTRRAQACNWLIYYREKLFGKSLEQLKEEREREKPKSEEIEALPSEKHYQKTRLD